MGGVPHAIIIHVQMYMCTHVWTLHIDKYIQVHVHVYIYTCRPHLPTCVPMIHVHVCVYMQRSDYMHMYKALHTCILVQNAR